MDAFFNPVIVSIALMIALCLIRVNVFISIILASLVCGMLSGVTLVETLDVFISGMSGNNSLVLSMLLFGIVVDAIDKSGVGAVLAPRLSRLAGKHRWMLFLILFAFAVLSESVFMLGPSFVPVVVPPLVGYANKLKVDRRCIAAVIVGGLQAGYACIPFGFGLIFHQTIQKALAENGLAIEVTSVWKSVWPFGLALILGAGIAIILYRKPRDYTAGSADTITIATPVLTDKLPRIERKHWVTIAVAIATIVSQFLTSSLPLGALIGIALLLLLQVIPWKDFERTCARGFGGFGSVVFILMAAAGFAAVFREYGQINVLVSKTTNLIGDNKLIGALVMLLLGLIITIGIGSGFAAVPIVSTVIVPMCARMNFDVSATILIIAASTALGDGVTPASSQTLLSTASLNLDGGHDHIRDTCMPVFLCYGLPVLVAVIVAVSVL